MTAAKDYKLGDGTGNAYDTGDLVFENGDLSIVDSDTQHVQDTITAFAGWWKEYPADGVGLYRFLNGSANLQLLAQDIKIQLQLDGYFVSPNPLVKFVNGKLTINPNATRL